MAFLLLCEINDRQSGFFRGENVAIAAIRHAIDYSSESSVLRIKAPHFIHEEKDRTIDLGQQNHCRLSSGSWTGPAHVFGSCQALISELPVEVIRGFIYPLSGALI